MRVLKPGGRFFFTMVNRWALDGFWLFQRGREVLSGGPDTSHPHCEFFSPAELEEELRAVGVRDLAVFGRMLAPLRVTYKLPRWGRRLASRLEKLDDLVHQSPLATPFAGHLIVAGSKP